MRRIVALACTACIAIGTARADTTLVVSMAADPTGLDPEAVLNNTSGFVMATIYDGLIRYKPGTVEVEPGLAQSWDVSSDALTYTFHLRKGVKYHDGTPFNAQALIATLDRQLKKDDPNYIGNSGPVQNLADFTYGSVASYRAVDDSTVEFKMKEPSAALLASLAMVWNGVVSPTAAAKYGKEFRNHPVGSGPFIFREWRQRDQVVLDANPDYWKGKPKVDHLVFKEYPDAQAALLALKRGEVQIMGDVATPVIASIRSDPNLVLLTQPGLAVNGMAMPNDVPPFTDKRVRQALNYAVDKEAINKALYRRAGDADGLAAARGAMGLRQDDDRLSVRSGEGEGTAGGGRREAGLQGRAARLQHAARLQPGGAGSGGGAAGLFPEGRHRGRCAQARHRRVPRPGAVREVSGDVPVRLQRRQRRSGQLHEFAVQLEADAGRRHVALQERGGRRS